MAATSAPCRQRSSTSFHNLVWLAFSPSLLPLMTGEDNPKSWSLARPKEGPRVRVRSCCRSQMNKRIYCLGLSGALVCSCGGGDVGQRTALGPAAVTPMPRDQRPTPVAKNETLRAPLEYRDENESDRVFIENAERAIGQYSDFIAR